MPYFQVHNDGRTIWCSPYLLNAFLWFFAAMNESRNERYTPAQLQSIYVKQLLCMKTDPRDWVISSVVDHNRQENTVSYLTHRPKKHKVWKCYNLENSCFWNHEINYLDLKGLLLLLLSRFNHVWLCATPYRADHQAPAIPGILQARVLEWVAISLKGLH